jgi:Fic family protein
MHKGALEFSPLVQAALLHAQFESIHPFLDGNGRLGRLLIALLLVEREVLSEPLLYLSLYLKQHRSEYYDHLQRVRLRGEWEEWVEFFLEGICTTAESATALAGNLLGLFKRDHQKLQDAGRQRGSLMQVFQVLQRDPYLSIERASAQTHLSKPTVILALQGLESRGLVKEITGKQRYRIYAYVEYLNLLDEGTEIAR